MRAVTDKDSPVKEAFINFVSENAFHNGTEKVIEDNIQENIDDVRDSRGTKDNGISSSNGSHQDRDTTPATSAGPAPALGGMKTTSGMSSASEMSSLSGMSTFSGLLAVADGDDSYWRQQDDLDDSSVMDQTNEEQDSHETEGQNAIDIIVDGQNITDTRAPGGPLINGFNGPVVDTEDDVAALQSNVGLGSLVGMSWDHWRPEDNEDINGVGNGSGDAMRLHNRIIDAVMRLPREDMKTFGEFPSHDDVHLVQCDFCDMWLKKEALHDHYMNRHDDELLAKNVRAIVQENVQDESTETQEIHSQQASNNDQIKEDAVINSNVTTEHGSVKASAETIPEEQSNPEEESNNDVENNPEEERNPQEENNPEEENKENVPEKKHKSGSPGQRALERLRDVNGSGIRDLAPSVAAPAKKRKASGDTEIAKDAKKVKVEKNDEINSEEEDEENVPEKKSLALQRLRDINGIGVRDHAPSVAASAKKRKASPDAEIAREAKKSKVEKNDKKQSKSLMKSGENVSDKIQKCSLCPFVGQEPTQMAPHMKAVHEKKKKKATVVQSQWYDGTVYKCGLCEAEFKDNDSIRFHLRKSHNMKTNSKTFQDSMILFHVSLYKCKLCGAKVNRNRQAIRNHVRTSHGLTFLEYENSHEMKQNESKELLKPEERNVRNDSEKDRIYSTTHPLFTFVGKKVKILYDCNGWCDGVIDYFNIRLAEYHVIFTDYPGEDDYVTASDIGGVDIKIVS